MKGTNGDLLRHLSERAAEISEAWTARVKAAQVLTTTIQGAQSTVRTWLEFLGPATEGDEWAARELYKLVALHARDLGNRGKPTSVGLMQILLLEDTLMSEGLHRESFIHITRELTRIVVDAETLGQTERLGTQHLRTLRDAAPIVRIGPELILGFLIGPMDRDNIDAMFGRLMRESIGVGARNVILDTQGASVDDDTFHRTLEGFARSEVGQRVPLIVTGIRDIPRTNAALRALGVDLTRIRLESDLGTVLDQLLTESRSSSTIL